MNDIREFFIRLSRTRLDSTLEALYRPVATSRANTHLLLKNADYNLRQGGSKDLLLLWPTQLLPDVGASELDTKYPLELAENLGIWYSLARLIICNHSGLFINLLTNILLRELFFHARCLDGLVGVQSVSDLA